jgi:hypothetical protein
MCLYNWSYRKERNKGGRDFIVWPENNFHPDKKWSVCTPALIKGKKEGVPLYRYLKDPLVRKFGVEWYDKLVAEIDK